MFVWLCAATAAVIGGTALCAYSRTRDALHPAVITALPFGFMLGIWPVILNSQGGLEQFFSIEQLTYVQTIYLLSIVCFSIGLLSVKTASGGRSSRWAAVANLPRETKRRLYQAAVVWGSLAVVAYLRMIQNVGGFVQAYSRQKGGGWASSGYIGEAILLSFPAVVAIAVAHPAVRGRIRWKDAALALLFMSPHLIRGTFGGRRGPMFLAMATLFLAWTIARRKRPSLPLVLGGVGVAGLALLFVGSQRQQVYLGSGGRVEISRLWNVIAPETVGPGDTYVTGAANIVAADYYRDYYWGYRYFVTFFIRPIPKQIWPTKYEDMGATWIYGLGDKEDAARLARAAGMVTPGGSAMPSIADVYQEFAWGALLFYLLLGWAFAKVWSLHRARGGEWTVILAVMLALSVYLASQSFSAWAHRLLFMAVPIVLLWRCWIQRGGGASRRVTRQGARAERRTAVWKPKRGALVRRFGWRVMPSRRPEAR